MIFALDTNVLLDILYKDEEFHGVSKETLEKHSERGFFVISPEVYSELISAFSGKSNTPKQDLDRFLEEKQIALVEQDRESLALAGRKWKNYDKNNGVECSHCGEINNLQCEDCGDKVSWRNHIITDFLVGAHAEEKANALMTRDRGYFRNYFDVEIIDPAN